jgi:hypothetical protein
LRPVSRTRGRLPVCVHAVCPPLRHAPHPQVCRTEAPHTSSAVSRCQRSVITRLRLPARAPPATAPVSSPTQQRARQSADSRPLTEPSRLGQRRTRHPFNSLSEKRPSGVYASTGSLKKTRRMGTIDRQKGALNLDTKVQSVLLNEQFHMLPMALWC